MTKTGRLPIWMNGARATALQRTAERWWDAVDGYVRLPLTTFDPLTCALSFVDLLAYQRGIDRFAGESEPFYRLRVHHALRNARAAGTPVGMRQICANLELPIPHFTERMTGRDWDMTRVRFAGRGYARLHAEIDFVLRFYWQTCRRFEVVQVVKAATHYGAGMAGSVRSTETATHVAQAVPFRPAQSGLGFGVVGSVRSTETATHVAQAVPFRPARSALGLGVVGSVRSVETVTHVAQSVPFRPSRSSLPVGGFFSCRSRHIRSFAV